MRSVDLTPVQYSYLVSAGFLPADLRRAVAERSSESPRGNRTSMVLEDIVCQRFSDELTERLAQVGFDGEYKLTSEGSMLEGIIDSLRDEVS